MLFLPQKKSMGRKKLKRPKLARTLEEIFVEMQEIIDNTPSCSTVDVGAMLSESLMSQFDEELALALDIEAANGDSGSSDEELNDVINKVIGEEESNDSLANIKNNTPP
ncbi:uncharacterized protein LOC117195000 isoform X2 [Drosophila miranda]|uniref:uncharacterized protein LOC108151430 isoform X2 n=1 Tax=Drosophila miranda TaxID=7229 RepID=UPI0007E6ED8C|nr:uncharacterized protein LOC108151430 isoform X2 [Drosophila miranda]XP_033255400.1 uncharacterized protein LOC117195000 isoform X2 [Drosophila miranda]